MDLRAQWDVLATWLRAHATAERGASLVEYALLVALIAVVCIAAVSLLGSSAWPRPAAAGAASRLSRERRCGRASWPEWS